MKKIIAIAAVALLVLGVGVAGLVNIKNAGVSLS